MATVKFNHVDNYTEKLASAIDSERTGHRAFKLVYVNKGSRLVLFCNNMLSMAEKLANDYDCVLQNGCQAPAGAGWDYDKQGNIIGEKDSPVLINYIFHGENSFEAAEALNNYYLSLK